MQKPFFCIHTLYFFNIITPKWSLLPKMVTIVSVGVGTQVFNTFDLNFLHHFFWP